MLNKPALKYVLFALFLVYILLLSKYILFTRMHSSPEYYFSIKHIKNSVESGIQKANLQPFETIKLMYKGRQTDTAFQYKNLGGNLLGFVPAGIFLPLLFKRLKSFPAVITVVFFISLSYEIIQLCTGLGVFDIDDLILNTAGGMIGFMVHFCASLIYRQPGVKETVEV